MKLLHKRHAKEQYDRLILRFPAIESSPAYDIADFAHEMVSRNVWEAETGTIEREPYITHPLRVANIIADLGVVDVDMITAALLHDTVEDAAELVIEYAGGVPSWTAESDRDEALRIITMSTSPKVSNIVEELTNPITSGLSREERHEQYIQHVKDISTPEARLVKIADFFDNAGRMEFVPPESRGYFSRRYAPLVKVYKGFLNDGSFNTLVKEDGLVLLNRLFDRTSRQLRS